MLSVPTFLSAYADAFQRCYPAKSVTFSKAKGGTYHIHIDGDKGNRPMTTAEIVEATEMLSR